MKKTMLRAALDNGRFRIDLSVSGGKVDSPYTVSDNAIKGFWSTPAMKTELTEAQTRNGSHSLPHRVLYASRVVTIPVTIHEKNRAALDNARTALQLLVGSPDVRFEVYDGSNSTYVEGMLVVEYERDIDERTISANLTLTCIDAERKSVDVNTGTIGVNFAQGQGGLFFGTGGKGLVFPMNFGKKEKTTMPNLIILNNAGSYEADVDIILNGYMNSASFEWSASDGRNGILRYDGFVGPNQKIILSSKTESATTGGSDVSGSLSYRNFPKVPALGSTRIIMSSTAQDNRYGYAEVQFRDTWM